MSRLDVQDPPTSLVRRLIDMARALVATIVVGPLAAAFLVYSYPGDYGSLLEDLRAGSVTVLEIGPALEPANFAVREPTTVARWRTADGTWHLCSLEPAHVPEIDPFATENRRVTYSAETDVLLDLLDDRSSYRDMPAITEIAEAYAPHGATVEVRPLTDNPVEWGLIAIPFAAELLLLVVLIAGPQPRYATKWAWFWLWSMPLSTGLLAYLTIETPWSDRPGGRTRRLTGSRAFLGTLLVTVVWGVLVGVVWGPLSQAWYAVTR